MQETKRIEQIVNAFNREYGPVQKERLTHVSTLLENGLNGQVTKVGEPVVDHIFSICYICVSEIGLGYTSVLAVLLYEAVNYGYISLDEIQKNYTSEKKAIVEGLLKISDFKPSQAANQAENFRSLLLNLATDIRVILIKLAERLKTMRSIKNASPDLQLKVAHEAFYLYAPLAHRLGLYKVKSEMEDLALRYTDPDTYFYIARNLNQTALARNTFIAEFIAPIEKRLREEGYRFEVKGRPKSIHSIYSKMQKSTVGFDEVYDKFAIRIILESAPEREKSDCWKVYSIITENYLPNTKRLRDWISVPKSNGYESLHTTVVVPGGQWVEVQIRTVRMDEIAEKGFAAHWKYKENKDKGGGLDEWLLQVREVLETPETNASDFIDDFKLSLYSKEIFVFTPKGDLKKFPQHATVLDFAYEVHSDVGKHCVGARLNGKNVSIKHELTNGDKVEILTSNNQKPKMDWLNFVVTSKAKSKIKQSLNEALLKDAEIGKDLIKRRFKNWKINYNDTNINTLLKHFKLKNALDFYAQVANEKIDISDVKELLKIPEEKPLHKEGLLEALPEIPVKHNDKEDAGDDFLVIDEKLANIGYKLAKCCTPGNGDERYLVLYPLARALKFTVIIARMPHN
ncbi:MAG: bifunctional (p)ppGpp synthetase/guanosine-3',5'-bis(diphosphate) 3'-pyrophosphohydrolase [Bacteroidales bacterium]|nr:bifunctional (p)ppGpp synthetase/guanosine-3',5'-bis(diphosphate) 3'-pyrophosphohydrolase [Bacteroidales bacterium]